MINRDMIRDGQIRNNVARIIDTILHIQIDHMLSQGIINVITAPATRDQQHEARTIVLDQPPRFPSTAPTWFIRQLRHARRYIQHGCRIHQGSYGPLYVNRVAGRYELRPRLSHHRPARLAEHISPRLAKHNPPPRTHGRYAPPKFDTRHGSRLRIPVTRH